MANGLAKFVTYYIEVFFSVHFTSLGRGIILLDYIQQIVTLSKYGHEWEEKVK